MKYLTLLLIIILLQSCTEHSETVICPCRVISVKEDNENMGTYQYVLKGKLRKGIPLGNIDRFTMYSKEWHLIGDTIQ